MIKTNLIYNNILCAFVFFVYVCKETMVIVTLTNVHAVLGFFALIALVTVLMPCMLCRKRRTEGTYQPSAEEQKQAESQEPEKPGLPLPLPKEERLI